jgi:NAD(P)-dependent dehydrogenase (short-subunit alcohol dehydrogenase family)
MQGKVVVIMGATSGIGRIAAEALHCGTLLIADGGWSV